MLNIEAGYPKHPDTVIIPPNEWYPQGLTEQTIWSYYDTNKARLVKEIAGAPVTIVTATPRGPVIRRNTGGGQSIHIDTVEQFDQLNNGRNIEFHSAAGKTTDQVWVDIDPMELVPWSKTIDIAIAVQNALLAFKTWGISISFSGGRGLHVRARLPKVIDIDKARELITNLMDEQVAPRFSNVTTGVNHSPDGTRLDVSTLHDTGSLRVPGSLNAKTGLVAAKTEDTGKGLAEVEKSDFTITNLTKYRNSDNNIHIPITAAAFMFDPNSTENEGRWRLRDPQDFDQATFRRWHEWAGVKAPKGVAFIIGNLTDGQKAIQTIRFDKSLWEEPKAAEFWASLQDKPGFERSWSWKAKASLDNILVRTAELTPDKAERIRKMLADTAAKHGFTIYGTGGYVRDRLMGYTPDDFDVAVYKEGLDPEKAKLEFAKHLVEDHNLPQPISYGQTNTQFIDIDGDKVEVNNHGRTLQEEAKNRDYTVNALFEDLQNPGSDIVDPTGLGIQDAKNKVLRAADPTNPTRLYQESPERILRGIRFMASRGMELEPATLGAMKSSVDLLADTAKENIGREFRKMLGHKASPKAWRLATEIGIAPYIVPEWKAMQGLEQRPDYHNLPVDAHSIAVMENVPEDLVMQLAAILHDTGKPSKRKIEDSIIKFHDHEVDSRAIADRVLRDLGFPEDIRSTVVKLVGEHMRPHSYRAEWSDKTVRKLVRDLGGDVDKAMELARADLMAGNPEKVEERMKLLEELGARIKREQEAATTPLHEMKPILDGRELQSLFQRPPGKWIGDAQKYLLDLQLSDPNITKGQATEAIRAWLESGQPSPAAEDVLTQTSFPGSEEKKAQMAPQKQASRVGHGIISAFIESMTPEQNLKRMEDLKSRVSGMGYKWEEMDGSWKGVPEKSLLIKNIPEDVMQKLTEEFCQEAYVTMRAAGLTRISFIVHMPGHKNSKGEASPWVIKSHETGKILSSHKSEEEAKKHLQHMHMFKGSGLVFGTSGFGHDAWSNKFYPKAMLQNERLGFYSKHFSAVEITATRHSVPPTRVLQNWAISTPAGFVFSFCAPITVRPSNMATGGAEIMRSFMRRIAAVGDKLGPVVLHIGELEQYSDGDAKKFFDVLPPHRYALQIDSKAWENIEVLDEMLQRGYVVVDTLGGTTLTDRCGWTYRRLPPSRLGAINHLVCGCCSKTKDYMFVVDKTAAFPSKELMQALKDLGLTLSPDGLTMLPYHGPMDPQTGPANSALPSGSYDDERGEPLTVIKPTNKDDDLDMFGKKNPLAPLSQFPSMDENDGSSDPLTGMVDGDTRKI
jgi:tRNA nucleotidyltransferase/poly(A) polymerase